MRRHAVVLGASMAGLGVARALRDHYERVTILERDDLPNGPVARKGVPQGTHAHALLVSGQRILDAWFPGLMKDLLDAGTPRGDVTKDFLWFQYGAWKLRTEVGLAGICATRPFLEHRVREHLLRFENVKIEMPRNVQRLVVDAKDERVLGVVVQDRLSGREETVDADLVVDALGRGSPSPRWLGEVPMTAVTVNVGYATGVFERRAGDFRSSNGGVIAGSPPASRRSAGVLAVEGDRWLVTLMGALGDHPSTEIAEWKAFAKSLPIADVFDLVRDRTPLGPITTYRFTANQWRHYERHPRFPAGYLVIGDALATFNPIYGQGMSVALCEASALGDCLARGDAGNLAKRFFKEAKKIISGAWSIATGEDYRHPEVEGRRPPGFALVSRYMDRVHRAATRDPVVLRRFFEVGSLLASPTAMMGPDIAWRVLFRGGDTLRRAE